MLAVAPVVVVALVLDFGLPQAASRAPSPMLLIPARAARRLTRWPSW
ncbi:hypothetical protein ACFQ0T_10975 [Kitasatospora gansuensis]